MIKIEGIIISISHYKNNDAIINILTKDGILTVNGRGSFLLKNPTNKYLKQFLYGEFDLYQGPTRGYKLRECRVIEQFDSIFRDYKDLMILNFLSELTFILTIDNSDLYGYYQLLLETLKAYKIGINRFAITCYYFAQLLKINGLGLNLDACVDCNNITQIVGIDFNKGGVVCKQHATPMSKIIGKREFNFYKTFFDKNIDNAKEISLSKIEFIDILNNLNYIYSKSFGNELKSINLLTTI